MIFDKALALILGMLGSFTYISHYTFEIPRVKRHKGWEAPDGNRKATVFADTRLAMDQFKRIAVQCCSAEAFDVPYP